VPKNKIASIVELRWDDIKNQVIQVNPEFAEIINNIKNKNDFPLYKVTYPFGSTIIDSGKFQLPLKDGTLVPISHSSINQKYYDQLNYNSNSIPFGIVLDKSIELFLQTQDRVIPSVIHSEGKLLGLWSSLSSMHVWLDAWHMTAGSRSIFVLPKITDNASHKKLCKARGIKAPLPGDLNSHWNLLTKLAAHSDFSEPWFTETLFFSNKWFVPQKDNNWVRFQNYLYQKAWKGTETWRSKAVYDHIWDSIIRELTKSQTKIAPFIVDIVKHIITIGIGAAPGFCPATCSKKIPIKGLQQDFIDLYSLKNYAPTIMVPHHFSKKSRRKVYWSLAMPTHFESNVKPKKLNSTLAVLREIKELMLYFKEVTLKKPDSIKGSPMETFLNDANFDFFHSEPDVEGEIGLSLELPKKDDTLVYTAPSLQKRGFSDVSPFVRGCVRFSF